MDTPRFALANITRASIFLLAPISLLAATVAQAQMGGGHGHGGRGGQAPSGAQSTSAVDSAPAPRPTPANQVEIVGVVTAIDVAAGRVTIAYDAVEALNWPAGAMPFVVGNPALLTGVSVGEKVRFKLDSEQIYALEPFSPKTG